MIDSVQIYSAPDAASPVLGQAKKGDQLRVSSKSRSGWFKVLVPGTESAPQYGWVSGDGLRPQELSEDQRLGHIQPGNTQYQEEEETHGTRTWSLAALLYVTTYNPRDFQGLTGSPNSVVSSVGPALELGMNTNDTVGFGLHYHYFSTSGSAASSQSYSLTTHFFDFIAEIYVLSQEYERLSIGLGIVTTLTSASVNRLDPSGGPNISGSESWISAGALIRASYRQYFVYRFGFMGDAGFRYLTDKHVPIGQSTPSLQLSGFFFEGGLFYDF